ncbi:MAG TPA: autotransporter protein [Bacteroidetes bacterium]|nr:autotransporter protein [Bacteroidota bacterium]
MKRSYHAIRTFFLILLLLWAAVGCEESAPLQIDPIEMEDPFTFTPTHGYPGTTVKIEGEVTSNVEVASVGSIAAEIASSGSGYIHIVVPVGATTGKIKLVKGNQVITSNAQFVVDESPIPTIIEFTPAIAGSGEIVTITGSMLDMVDSVYIGNLKAEIQTGATAASMDILTPVGMQTGKIRLFYTYMTSYGVEKVAESTSDADLVLALPTITSIEPNILALNIGDVVTITGTMLDEVTEVKFADLVADFDIVSATELTATVPVGATTGELTLTVPDGMVSAGTFRVNLPVIDSFSPDKGEEDGGIIRAFSISGTKLDLVDNVLIGTTPADIQTQTATLLIVTVPGDVAGFITLETANGNVKTSVPFFFTGEFWVNDWETIFAVDRYDHISNNNFGSFTLDETGDYAHFILGDGGGVNNRSFYLWAPGSTDDKFSLFTPDPDGVYLEFDLNVMEIPDSCKLEDGTVKIKVFAMDSKGWGASGEYSYGYNGPTVNLMADGDWHHFSFHLKDFVASNNSGLYTVDQVSPQAGAFCHPNSLRILAFVFGTATENGHMVLGLDNVKFVIN